MSVVSFIAASVCMFCSGLSIGISISGYWRSKERAQQKRSNPPMDRLTAVLHSYVSYLWEQEIRCQEREIKLSVDGKEAAKNLLKKKEGQDT